MYAQSVSRLRLLLCSCAVSALAWGTVAHAAWPEMPIRVVVPYPAGAAGDLALRQMLPHLQARLGQPMVIDNKPGAGGNIGTSDVVRAKPDGYTLLLGATNNFVINQYLYKSMGYDPLQALAPITKVVNVPSVLFINGAVPARSFREFADYAKARPGKLNFGSPGNGTAPHLSGFALSEAMGAQMTHVPYKGAQPGVTGLIGGEVQMFLVGYGVAGAQLASGRIRALAVVSRERLKAQPDLPTAAEAGVPDVILSNWWGLAAPRGTDPAILKRLADEVHTVLALPGMQQYLSAQGFVAAAGSPESFSRQLTEEAEQWQGIVKKSGATVD
ncbi:MAG: tripartite tricarboxylate transporter substrate binding protein [Comamonadaceae bacterium]|nr:tripartite tricarboxylate transporter substrate binding protein [Comamonadaceae bacterium]